MSTVRHRVVLLVFGASLLLAACDTGTVEDPTAHPDPIIPVGTAAPTVDGGATGGPPTGGGGGVTGACAAGAGGSVADGWSRTVTPGWLQADGGDIRVELHYAFELTDALREGITTDRIWDRLLSTRYRAGATVYGGEAFGLPYYTAGPATDLATGAAAYIMVAYEPAQGIAQPVVAIAPDEATFASHFADSRALVDMLRYNYLPLSCGSLGGTWTTSSSSAAEAYDASGSYTGIVVAASSVDITFAGDGTYALHEESYLDGVAHERDEAGSVTTGEQEVILHAEDGTETAFNAAWIAVGGGLALFLGNRQFTGERYVLYPAR